MYASSFAQQLGNIGAAVLSGANLPAERLARIATRRAFVEMKQRFMQAVERVCGEQGSDLRERVRRAQEPIELWMLRGAVFAELSMHEPAGPPQGRIPAWRDGAQRQGCINDQDSRRERLDLRQALDSAFPNSGDITEPTGLPSTR